METLIKHAEAAAATHGVAAKVSAMDHMDPDGNWTGKKVVTARIFQEVWFDPDGDPRGGAHIDCRRFVGISRGDARRLYKSRKGRPGGQSYIDARTTQRCFDVVCDKIEDGVRELMDLVRSGGFRAAAHDVADDAARIEVEMRAQLRDDLSALKDEA